MNASSLPANILLAESSFPMRSLLVGLLESRGHSVRAAEDGLMARDFFELEPETFGVVVIRSRLPRMNGVDLFKLVRTMAPEKPVLFIKESEDEEIVGLGPDCEVITKPFTTLEFVSAIQRCLA
jgi:DNA-binding response OmpR family regulator